ncbi:MAG: ATP-binding cassette domain-containing protein [Planctomycetales bacterium]|nr:ATP-binding cassette domain-containing protein [Planctomycetales bacterium]
MEILIDNLTLRYDGHLLFENLSIRALSGQKLCIAGPSGCGKSSLFRAVLGFIRPQQGTISIAGQPMNDKSVWHLRRHIAYVTQEPDLGQEVVLDRIRRPFDYKTNAHLAWSPQAVKGYFERFKLSPKLLQKQTTDLSGGEKQRVAIIIGLLLNRPILLLDEPASALDKESRQILKNTLCQLSGKTVLVVSHDEVLLDNADAVIDIAVFRRGL